MAPNRPFQVDPILTAIAIGYSNPSSARIADRVLPRTPVGAEKFGWTEYPLAEAFNIPDARVSRRGRVQQLEFGGEQKTGEVEDYGLDSPIPYTDIDAAREARERGVSTFDPEGHATTMLMDTVENIREVRVAGMVHNADNYSVGRKVTLSGSDQFSHADSNPITVIKTGIESTLVFPPNTMVMGRAVWSKLSSHAKIVNAVKGGTLTSGLVSREQFLELFAGEGIKELLIGDAWYNTAKPGQAASLARAWGKHVALIHKNEAAAAAPNGGITFGLTAQYGTRFSGRIEDEDVGLYGGVRVRTGERVKELILAKDTGYFIQNAVA